MPQRTIHSTAWPPHVVLAGGVTGGHLFAGLALAEEILSQAPSARITFAGPGAPFDRGHVAGAGHAYLVTNCPRTPQRLSQTARFVRAMWQGYRTAKRFLDRERVTTVVGLGGFASVPASLAAARQSVPLVLLESNAIVGRANRWLARGAECLCLAFDETRWAPARNIRAAPCPVLMTGTPVRSTLLEKALAADDVSTVTAAQQLSEVQGNAPRQPVLLVLGGSGGARQLNQCVPAALASLRPALSGWRVVHQTGPADESATAAVYRAAGVPATVAGFFNDMPSLLADTRMAVCRAGGSTLAELAALRIPAILVPWSAAQDNHQCCNAQVLAAAGASVMIDADLTTPAMLVERLASAIGRLIDDPARRWVMARSLSRRARPDAAQRIAAVVLRRNAGHHLTNRQKPPVRPYPLACIDTAAA